MAWYCRKPLVTAKLSNKHAISVTKFEVASEKGLFSPSDASECISSNVLIAIKLKYQFKHLQATVS